MLYHLVSENPTSPKVDADAFKQPAFPNDVSDAKCIESKDREVSFYLCYNYYQLMSVIILI